MGKEKNNGIRIRDITPAEWLVMDAISSNEGGGKVAYVTQSQLCDMLSLSKTTVNRSIAELSEIGWLERPAGTKGAYRITKFGRKMMAAGGRSAAGNPPS